MIVELIKGLVLAGVGFVVIMLLCLIIGKIAGYFSPYKDIK